MISLRPRRGRDVFFPVFSSMSIAQDEIEKLAALACDLASVEYEVFSFYDRITE